MKNLILILLSSFFLSGCLGGYSSYRIDEKEAGFASGSFDKIDYLVSTKSRETGIPGGVLVIRRNNHLIYRKAFGKKSPFSDRGSIDEATLFDTASLTKPMAGVPAAILMGNKFNLTVDPFSLVSHSSGVCDELNTVDFNETILQRLDNPETCFLPGEMDCYSNFAYAVLGNYFAQEFENQAIETIRDEFWNPIGINTFTYFPQNSNNIAVSGINARGEELVGVPYDPLSHLMLAKLNMVPLQSGLFATGDDVAYFFDYLLFNEDKSERLAKLRALLFEGVAGRESCLKENQFVYRSLGGLYSPTEPPLAPTGSPAGRYFFQSGYTGCFVWVDIETGTVVAFLSNAVASTDFDDFADYSHELVRTIWRGLMP